MRRLAGALCGVALAFGLGCNSGFDVLDTGGTHAGPVQLPPIEMQGVIFEGYHGDLRDLSVTADSATVDMTAHVANLTQVTMGFTGDEAGKVEISAPAGLFHLDADDFTLSNGVHGKTEEGERFTTATAQYVAARRVIQSSTPVELHRSNLVLTASGMEMEVATHKLRLTGNVRARVQSK